MARKISVEIVGDSASLTRAFDKAGLAGKNFSRNIGISFGTLLKSTLIIDGVQKALQGLGTTLHLGIAEFSENAKVAAQTAAAIKSTGGVAGVTAARIDALGLSLSNLSGVDDEVVRSGENILLSFTKIRDQVGKGNDIFSRATKDALDFAIRTGRDVPTAARILGVALENPARKATALSRAGIVLTKSQIGLIKSLQDSGHALEAQKLILSEVEKRFGGAAAAAGKTLPGQLNILRDRFKDLAGSGIGLVAPAVSKAVTGLTDFIKRLSEVKGGEAKLKFAVTGVGDLVSRIAKDILAKIKATDWGSLFATIGHLAARGAGKLISAFDAVDWGQLASNVGGRIKSAFTAIDWNAVGHTIIDGFGRAGRMVGNAFAGFWQKEIDILKKIDFQKVGKAIIDGLGLAVVAVGNFLKNVDWGKLIGTSIRLAVTVLKGFGSLFLGAGTEIGHLIGVGVKKGLAALGARVGDALHGALRQIKVWALEAAIFILKPFDVKLFGHPLISGLDNTLTSLKKSLTSLDPHAKKVAKAVQAALDEVNLRNKTFHITGFEAAVAQAKAVKAAIAAIKDRKVRVSTTSLDVDAIQKKIDDLHGKILEIEVRGTEETIRKAEELKKQIDALKGKKLAVDLGWAKGDAHAIQAQIDHLHGKLIELHVTGSTEAIAKAKALQKQIDALEGRKVEVELSQTGARAVDIQAQIDRLKGKIVKLGLIGSPEAVRQVVALQGEIDGLHGKKVQIELQGKRKTADIQREIDGLHGKVLQLQLIGGADAIANAQDLQKEIDKLRGKQVAIELRDGNQAAAIQARIDKLKGKIVTLGVSGSQTAIAQAQALQKQIDALKGKSVSIKVHDFKTAVIQKKIDDLHGKIVDLGIVGGPAAMAEVALLQKQIDALKGKKVRVQVELGQPGAEAGDIQKQIDHLHGKLIELHVTGSAEAIAKAQALQKQIVELKSRKLQVELGWKPGDVRAIQAQIDRLKGRIVKLGVAGTPEAIAKAKALRKQIDGLKDRQIRIRITASSPAVQAIQAKIDRLHGKILRLGVAGTPEAIAQAAALQKQIDALKGKSVSIKVHDFKTAVIQKKIDDLHGKIVRLGVKGTPEAIRQVADLDAQIAALHDKQVTISVKQDQVKGAIESRRNFDPAEAAKTVARQAKVDEALGLKAVQTAKERAAAIKAAMAKAAKELQRMFDTLDLAVSKAGLTKSLADDLVANQHLIAAITQQIKLHKDDLDLQNKLVSAQQARLALVQQQKDAEVAARTVAQFKTLGLDATGQALTPLKSGLARELAKVTSEIGGTSLDTGKNQKILAAIRKLILDPFTKVSKDVRATIKQMLDGIDQQLKDHGGRRAKFRTVSADKILNGLGLTPEQFKAATSRLTQLGPRGLTPAVNTRGAAAATGGGFADVIVHNHVILDGKEIAHNTTKHQQKAVRRTSGQTRGRHAGNPLGTTG